jgi:hypothetical protein
MKEGAWRLQSAEQGVGRQPHNTTNEVLNL